MSTMYRQILTMRRRAEYDPALEDEVTITRMERYQPFLGLGSDITVTEVCEQYDWAEPFPSNSPWLKRRRDLVAFIERCTVVYLAECGGDGVAAQETE